MFDLVDHSLLFVKLIDRSLPLFRLRHTRVCLPDIIFNNVVQHYSDEVTHLGHILSSDLDDKSDIIRVVKDLNR